MARRNNESHFGERKRTYRIRRLLSDVAGLAPRITDLAAVYVGRSLTAAEREAIMLAVARVNACRFCSFVHGTWAREVGLDDEAVEELLAGGLPGLDEQSVARLAFARALATQDFQGSDDDELVEAAEALTPRERRDVEAVARAMSVANRFGNTFDALLGRLSGKPIPESRVLDELVLSSLFALVAPSAAVALAFTRREGPLRLYAAFRAFSERFEESF